MAHDTFTTHDGPIYVVERAQMHEPRVIVERMAGDMAAQVRDRGFWDWAELQAQGWPADLIEAYWRDASDRRIAAKTGSLRDKTTIGRELLAIPVELACIGTFLFAVYQLAAPV